MAGMVKLAARCTACERWESVILNQVLCWTGTQNTIKCSKCRKVIGRLIIDPEAQFPLDGGLGSPAGVTGETTDR